MATVPRDDAAHLVCAAVLWDVHAECLRDEADARALDQRDPEEPSAEGDETARVWRRFEDEIRPLGGFHAHAAQMRVLDALRRIPYLRAYAGRQARQWLGSDVPDAQDGVSVRVRVWGAQWPWERDRELAVRVTVTPPRAEMRVCQ